MTLTEDELARLAELEDLLTVGLVEQPINGSVLSWGEAALIAHRIGRHLLRAAPVADTAGIDAALVARHAEVCACPFDGSDDGCNLLMDGVELAVLRAAAPAPDPGAGPDLERLGLSAEQTAILRDLLASRQQTVSEWLGDALMYWGLGRAGKEYPPAKSLAPSAEPPETET